MHINSFLPGDKEKIGQHLNNMGAPFGIEFGDLDIVPNSRMALAGAEFARGNGLFDQFHEVVFSSYFTLGRDIGQISVISEIGRDVGLDADGLRQALQEGTYLPVLESVRLEANRWGVTAAPTFIVEGKDCIVGAQAIEVFRRVLLNY